MIYYYIFIAIMLLADTAILVEAVRHIIYTRRNYKPKPRRYTPRAALISPCKGIDTTFEKNIRALFHQDYPDYEIIFVVQAVSDPAYEALEKLITEYRINQNGPSARILISGHCVQSSQKVHNLMAAVNALGDNVEVMAFVDSDACPPPHFLGSLVHPLRRQDIGAATGYRWFVPTDNRLSSAVMSALNAFVASMMGPHGWNSAWGGSMAIRRDVFNKTHVADLWQGAPSDDYALTYAVKKAGLDVSFVPACFVPSFEAASWSGLWEFAVRQFIITRICRPKLWWLAVLSRLSWCAAFWGGWFITLWRWLGGFGDAHLALIGPAVLWGTHVIKSLSRQILITRIFPDLRSRLWCGGRLDVIFGPLLAVFMLALLAASAVKRRIRWRGIDYELIDVGHTRVLSVNPKNS